MTIPFPLDIDWEKFQCLQTWKFNLSTIMKVSLSALTKKEYINTEGTLYLSLVLKTAPAFSTKFSTTPHNLPSHQLQISILLHNCRYKTLDKHRIELSTSYFSTGANSTTTINWIGTVDVSAYILLKCNNKIE